MIEVSGVTWTSYIKVVTGPNAKELHMYVDMFDETSHNTRAAMSLQLWKDISMAQSNAVAPNLEPLERAWIKKSLQLQRQSLVRGQVKEVPGSEVYQIRVREIQSLDVLIGKFS